MQQMFLPSQYEFIQTPLLSSGAIPGLYVKRTHLKKGNKRLDFNGLFTQNLIKAGDFIGFYSGNFYDDDDDFLHQTSSYAMSASGYTVIPPGEFSSHGVDPQLYPIAMANEPPLSKTSNAFIKEWRYARECVPGMAGSTKIDALCLHACRDILPHEEIYYYYGDSYDRRKYGRKPHNVGAPCYLKTSLLQKPIYALNAHGIHHILEDSSFRQS